MAENRFEGFANSPTDKKGKTVLAVDVPAYKDESEAGKVRDASLRTPSAITKHKTADKSTDGPPMAVVGPKAPDAEVDTSDADAAEGEEDSDSGDETS